LLGAYMCACDMQRVAVVCSQDPRRACRQACCYCMAIASAARIARIDELRYRRKLMRQILQRWLGYSSQQLPVALVVGSACPDPQSCLGHASHVSIGDGCSWSCARWCLSAPELCNTAHRLGGARPACTLQVTLRVARPQLMPVTLWVVIAVQASWLSSLRINAVKPALSAICSMPVLAYLSSCIAQNILKRIFAECKHLGGHQATAMQACRNHYASGIK
jgi:hypothetical protein